jgi:hypothetical protein
MKRLAILVLLTATAVADPLREDRDVVDVARHPCPKGLAFTDVTRCLAKNAHVQPVGSIVGARLVRLDIPDRPTVNKLMLYAEANGAWRIVGEWTLRDLTVVDFQALTLGKHTGYRIDVGQAFDVTVNVENADTQAPLSRPGLVRTSTSLFCGSAALGCDRIMTDCEVLVRGKALWMFHGQLKVEGKRITVDGDRRHTGSWCTAPGNLFLRWPR